MQAAFYAITNHSPVCVLCGDAAAHGLNPMLFIANTRLALTTFWNGIGEWEA